MVKFKTLKLGDKLSGSHSISVAFSEKFCKFGRNMENEVINL